MIRNANYCKLSELSIQEACNVVALTVGIGSWVFGYIDHKKQPKI